MLRWALGYLAMAVVVAIGFSALQSIERSEARVTAAAAKEKPARAGSEHAGEADDEGYSNDDYSDDSYADDDGYVDDDGYADDDYADDGQSYGGYAEDESPPEDLEYVVRSGPGGHYLLEVVVNGAPITFLVDTGASDIVLTLEDARRVGLDPRTLDYSRRYATANGEVRGAPVVLRELRVGQLRLFDVDASVNEGPLAVSLLGMEFLARLDGYEVQRGRMILRW
jgi:clan AA aspartic protease (TIGR02281 family)